MRAKAFEIPYLIVHDEDPLPDPIPDDWGPDKTASKQRTFRLNHTISEMVKEPLGTIKIMSPDFEKASGVSRSQGYRKGKALAALDHFEGIAPDHIPQEVIALVQAVYGARSENEPSNA